MQSWWMDRLVLGAFMVSIGFNVITSETLVHDADTTVADALTREVRVACLLTMSDADFKRRLTAVTETWGSRCNKFAISKSQKEPNTTDMIPSLWQKFRLHAAFQQYGEDVDWFVLSSGGYILLENLRFMLSEYNPQEKLYFKPNEEFEGLKLIISKNAISHLVTTDLSYFPFCNFSSTQDISISCFNSIGLRQMYTKDFLNRERILPLNPYNNKQKKSLSYSDFAVSFENVESHMMYVIDYLVYQLRPFGINFDTNIPKSQRELKKKLDYQKIHNDIPKTSIMNKINEYYKGVNKKITENKAAEVKGYLNNNGMIRGVTEEKKRIFSFE